MPDQICRLDTTVAELKKDAQEAKICNDALIDGLVGRLQEPQSKDRQIPGLTPEPPADSRRDGRASTPRFNSWGAALFPCYTRRYAGTPCVVPLRRSAGPTRSHRLPTDPAAHSSADGQYGLIGTPRFGRGHGVGLPGRIGVRKAVRDPRGQGVSLSSRPLYIPKRWTGEQGLEDRNQLCIWI